MADYNIDYGKTVTVTATANEGFEITEMKANSEVVANPYEFTINKNVAIEVTTAGVAASPAKTSTKAKK